MNASFSGTQSRSYLHDAIRLLGVLLVVCSTASVAMPVRFAAPTNVPLDYMDGLLIADLDKDKKPDVIAFSSRAVTILRGDGRGGFSRTNGISGGYIFSSLAAGDLNGDGMPDLVVLDSSLHTLNVYSATNDDFAEPVVHPISGGAISVAVADFNKDGRLDYVTANTGFETITILFGNGRGGLLSAGQNYDVVGSPYWVAAVDLDDDGNQDIVTCNPGGNTVSLFYGLGDGSFTSAAYYPVGGSPRSATFGDFNGDHKLDMATANSGSNSVSVLLQTGSRSLSPATIYKAGNLPLSVAANDVNGDGLVDLIAANFSSQDVRLLLGQGDGTFTPGGSFLTGGPPYGVGLGDMNGDGLPDIVTANNNLLASVSLLLNQTQIALEIILDGNIMKIRWPAYAVGGVLQATADLTSSGGWQTVTNAVSAEGEYNAISVAPVLVQRFFRLKSD